MNQIVVDASVAVKWLVPEEHSSKALKFLESGQRLLAPDFLWIEIGNILWKKSRRKEIAPENVPTVLGNFLSMPVFVSESKKLLPSALDWAQESSISVYDALYIALAIDQDCSFVTADRKLYDALFKLVNHQVIWIGKS